MRPDVNEGLLGDRLDAVRAIEGMLDYAMIGGAELRLPMFVFLLRIARMELMSSVSATDHGADVHTECESLPGTRPGLGDL